MGPGFAAAILMIRALSLLVFLTASGCDGIDLQRACDLSVAPTPPATGMYGGLDPGSSVVATRNTRHEGPSAIVATASWPTRYLRIGGGTVSLLSAAIDVDTLRAGGPYHFGATYVAANSTNEGGRAAVRVVRADAHTIEGTFRACVASGIDVFGYTGPSSLVEGGFHVLRADSAAGGTAAKVTTR